MQAVGAPIAVTGTQALAFGKIAAGPGGAVTMGWTGARSATGGVVLLQSGPGSAAQFSVAGDPSAHYRLTLPGNGIVVLSSGSNAMVVSGFTSNRAAGANLGLGGTHAASVGASLNVAAGQAPGSYTGSFSISVDYD